MRAAPAAPPIDRPRDKEVPSGPSGGLAVPLAGGLPGDPQHETDLTPAPTVLAGCGNSLVDLTLIVSEVTQG